MCLAWWHVISPQREQKDPFSHKWESYKLYVMKVQCELEDLLAQIYSLKLLNNIKPTRDDGAI